MKLIETMEGVAQGLRTIAISNSTDYHVSSLAQALVDELNSAITEYNRPIEAKDYADWPSRKVCPDCDDIEYYTNGVDIQPIGSIHILTVRDGDDDTATSDNQITAGELEVLRRIFAH